VKRMLEFGTTRVEIGVQTLDDDIYRLVNRGHLIAEVVTATALLKNYGFKVHYHWMPGLPVRRRSTTWRCPNNYSRTRDSDLTG